MLRTKNKPIDDLYKFHGNGEFDKFVVNKDLYPELYSFVETVKKQGTIFGNYPEEKLEYFTELLNELRKNNTNNPT